MTAKEYLSQIRRVDDIIRALFHEIENAKQLAASITIAFGDDRVQTSGNKDRLGNIMSKVADLEIECATYCRKYIALKRKILSEIQAVDNNTYKHILILHFVQCKPLSEVADIMNYSWRNIARLNQKAIDAFGEKYKHKLS